MSKLYSHLLCIIAPTRRALGGAHVPPTKVLRRLTGSVNKTIVKPCVTAAVGRTTILKPRLAAPTNTYTSGKSKVPRSMAYTIAEEAIQFRHLDYNPDRTQKLISSSMSRHLYTCNISSKCTHTFLLTDRQTERQMR